MPKEGKYQRGPEGAWHYCPEWGEDIRDAVKRAVPVPIDNSDTHWFWFQGTPAPVYRGDSKETLAGRWCEWRDRIQADPTFQEDQQIRFNVVRR